jgi:hypothetical protein
VENKPKLDLVRPSAAVATRLDSNLQKAALRADMGESRLVVQMSAAEHQALKVHVATLGLSLRDYVMGLLARDGAFHEK